MKEAIYPPIFVRQQGAAGLLWGTGMPIACYQWPGTNRTVSMVLFTGGEHIAVNKEQKMIGWCFLTQKTTLLGRTRK